MQALADGLTQMQRRLLHAPAPLPGAALPPPLGLAQQRTPLARSERSWLCMRIKGM